MTNRKHNTHLSQSDIALQIDALVQAIEYSDTPAYRITHKRSGYERVERTRLSHHFTHVQQMCNLFDDRVPYDYSEHLLAFREACDDVGLQRSPNGPVCMSETGTYWLSYEQSMNVLTERIRELTRQRWYQRKAGDRAYEARKQAKEIIAYNDAVMSLYSRTTIIRLDLYYRTEAQARQRVEQVFDHLDDLIYEHSRNPIFEHLIGYTYSVEQGECKKGRGYHIHAAYYFNGNIVCRDVCKATRIGKLWEEITRRQGYAHSCNHDKDQYGDKLGIGQIHRDDQSKRPNTHEAMRYLVKDDQHLRVKPAGARCLRKGALNRVRRI
ncbi:inovirus-type Gp2 protein [Aquipseudomonas alcaligenes]|uniref:Inovirus Gp2 family protein n=1 Tax=Aquipseudomonas alcaligenes (strain ATCC 14909 / DSM 50342 / CCUG 1425 / JCM 20561 / NBRC 14159 / NCIMB 9945 / NCTC 10367 / 1577) TaxID=1215092 RepID=U2ZQV6_AQUA1|nr:inovirus-type Gp2 protein [Pseudomonas alcaligenes]GAD63457.1 hypothetical protein PA6_024_00280 [Pseudomonas alcaligenes NBRC 14159]SUD16821.1 Protein of uncharacterised function (DUF3296) [Pseudomonas alcaligenes]